MGCSVCSIKSKTAMIFLRKEDTKVSFQIQVLKPETSIVCLKIDLQPSLHPIMCQNLKHIPNIYSYIKNYIQYLNTIKLSYARLVSYENNFKFLTHSWCLDSTINSSIKVMLVSISASNKGQLPINILNNLPFFSISPEFLSPESLPIYNSWKEFCTELQTLLDPIDPTLSLTECQTRLQEFLDDYLMHKESFLSIDHYFFRSFLESAISLVQWMIKKVKKTILVFKKFFFDYPKYQNKIRFIGYKAWSFAAFKAKEIVHIVLKENFCN